MVFYNSGISVLVKFFRHDSVPFKSVKAETSFKIAYTYKMQKCPVLGIIADALFKHTPFLLVKVEFFM